MTQGLDVLAKFHERSEGRDAGYLAFYDLTHFVGLEPLPPNVVDLLNAQRYPAIFRVDLQHLSGYRLTFLEYLVRVFYSARPADIADVHQPIKSLFDFDEGAKLRDVAYFPGDHRAYRILLGDLQPRIGQGLFHPQRNAAVAGLDVQHHHVHVLPDFHQL